MTQRENVIDAEVRAIFRKDAQTYKREYHGFIRDMVAPNFAKHEKTFAGTILDEIGPKVGRHLNAQWWD